jgi:hypothetical protein
MAALELTGLPAKVYWTTMPYSAMAEFGRIMAELGMQQPEELEAAQQDAPPIGLPDEAITTWVDVAEFGERKYEALAAHASQSENIFLLDLGTERFTRLMGTETFLRVHDSTGAALPENDLFAGLR